MFPGEDCTWIKQWKRPSQVFGGGDEEIKGIKMLTTGQSEKTAKCMKMQTSDRPGKSTLASVY